MSWHPRVWTTATPGRYVGDGHPDAVLLAAGSAGQLPADFDVANFEPTSEHFDDADEAPADEPEVEQVDAPEPVVEDAPAPVADEAPADEPAPAKKAAKKAAPAAAKPSAK